MTRTVRISATTTVHPALYTLDDDEEEPNLWYGEEDCLGFRREMIQDGISCIRMLARKASLRGTDAEEHFHLTQDEIAQCVGLEVLLSPNLRNQILASRRRHVHVILRQQTLQRIVDGQNAQDLANISWASSQWTRERSIAIARRYSLEYSDE